MTDNERMATAYRKAAALRYRLWYLQKWPWAHWLSSDGGIVSEKDPR